MDGILDRPNPLHRLSQGSSFSPSQSGHGSDIGLVSRPTCKIRDVLDTPKAQGFAEDPGLDLFPRRGGRPIQTHCRRPRGHRPVPKASEPRGARRRGVRNELWAEVRTLVQHADAALSFSELHLRTGRGKRARGWESGRNGRP